ncbi:hypothetical protein Ancab_026113 [Ancistrocladus abbreviatus]
MGCKFSKSPSSSSTTAPPPLAAPANSTSLGAADLTSYLAACELDRDVQVFDSALHDRTSRVINSLADGVAVRSLSFDSLQEVTGCLIDSNQEVVRLILDCKRDIWNNKDLFDLVQEYFDYSVQILDFFTALDKCLKRARDRQLIIRVALLQFEEEARNGGAGDSDVVSGDKYAKTLQELRNFKEAGDPFTEEFFTLFKSVYKQQVQMFDKLQSKKRKLDKKLKRAEVYRKVSNIIFAATFIAILICSVVAAAVAAPPVVTALAAAASAPMGGLGKWVNSLWTKYENELKGQRELIGSMQVGTYIAIKDLDSIRVLVDKLEIDIESLLSNADFALRHEEVLTMAIDEIKKKVSAFMEAIDDLTEHAEKYSRDVRRARTVILRRIISYPSSI